jgi:hypothetical protein
MPATLLAGPIVQIVAMDRVGHEDSRLPEWGIEAQQTRSRKATFLVSRTGSIGFPLWVNYWIGGTAANGVDYATLPGHVIIPAGKRSARIVVHPLDDTTPEWGLVGSRMSITESVILTLRPSKAYHVGPLNGAKVHIRDHLPPWSGGLIVQTVTFVPPVPPSTNVFVGFTNFVITPLTLP